MTYIENTIKRFLETKPTLTENEMLELQEGIRALVKAGMNKFAAMDIAYLALKHEVYK